MSRHGPSDCKVYVGDLGKLYLWTLQRFNPIKFNYICPILKHQSTAFSLC